MVMKEKSHCFHRHKSRGIRSSMNQELKDILCIQEEHRMRTCASNELCTQL
jgi:hypothetical protein